MSWNDPTEAKALPPITSIVGNQKPGPALSSLSLFRDSTLPTRPLPPTYLVFPHCAPAHSIVGDTHTITVENSLDSLPQPGETGSQHRAHHLSECMSGYIHNDQSYEQYLHHGNMPSKVMKIVSPHVPVYRQPTTTDLVPEDVVTASGVCYSPAYPMAHIPCESVHQTYTATPQQYISQTQALPPLSSKHNREYGIPGMLDQPNQRHPSHSNQYPKRISQPTHHQRVILSPANQNPSIPTAYQPNYIPISRSSPPPLNSQIALGPTQPPYQQTQSLSPVEIVTLSYKSSATPPPSSSILELRENLDAQYREMGMSQTGSYISSDVAVLRSERRHSSSSFSAGITADAANTLLAEKRRKNAGASARFRDRRRQKQKEADVKIESLTAQVEELKKEAEEFSKIPQLETELAKIRVERDAARERVKDLEIEIQVLRDVVQAGGFNLSATRTCRRQKRKSKHEADSDPVDERTTDSEGGGSGTWPQTNRRAGKHSIRIHRNTKSESIPISRIELGSRTSISLAASASECDQEKSTISLNLQCDQ